MSSPEFPGAKIQLKIVREEDTQEWERVPTQPLPGFLEDEEIILRFKVERLMDLKAVIKCHMLALTHWKVVN